MGKLKTYTISTDITLGAVNPNKLDKELRDSADIANFNGISTHGDSIDVYGDAFVTEANIDALILAHDSTDNIANIKASYITKEIDGCAYFADIRAQLVLDYQATLLTEQDLYDIEDAYTQVFRRIKDGDWMSAQNKLSSVTIGGAVTQARHDEITTYIGDYITNNY